MTVQHRMPTTRRRMEKDRFNSAVRKMTLEDRIVKRIWNGDVQEVILLTAVTRLAIERMDRIIENLEGDAYGFAPFERDRDLLRRLEARLPAQTDILGQARLELDALDNTQIFGRLPSEDEVMQALIAALEVGIQIDARVALFGGPRP